MKLNIVFESEKIRDAYMNGDKKCAWERGNSCIDMRCAEDDVILQPMETRVISSGMRLQIEHNDDCVEWLITSRSGMAKRGILCHLGTIDYNYTGIGGVCLTNLTSAPIKIEFGDRIAQLKLVRIEKPEIEFVEELNKTNRGDKGFGASGVK